MGEVLYVVGMTVGISLVVIGFMMMLVALFESGFGSRGSGGVPPVRVEHHLFLYDDSDSDDEDDD